MITLSRFTVKTDDPESKPTFSQLNVNSIRMYKIIKVTGILPILKSNKESTIESDTSATAPEFKMSKASPSVPRLFETDTAPPYPPEQRLDEKFDRVIWTLPKMLVNVPADPVSLFNEKKDFVTYNAPLKAIMDEPIGAEFCKNLQDVRYAL